MIINSHAKINIGLNVVKKREDGYHDIESMMYPVRGLEDQVEIIKRDKDGAEFYVSGLKLDCPPEKNLCMKTYNLMKEMYPDKIKGVKLHLHKVIPSGSGLGGGSSNVAAVIKGLDELFELRLSQTKMERIAAKLGSDAAFFLSDRPMFAAGRGELLYPAMETRPMKGYKLVILKPDVYVGTTEAYKIIKPKMPEQSLSKLIKHPIETWRGIIFNNFENYIFPLYPDIEAAKRLLYLRGAVFALMSGTGASVYGIFPPYAEPDFSDLDMFVYQEVME